MAFLRVQITWNSHKTSTSESGTPINRTILHGRTDYEDTPMVPMVLSADSHVFEPPDLWQTRVDRAFRDRAPRIERINGGDHVVVEEDQILSGIGLISNAGLRFEAPETISAQGRFEDVQRGGYDPEQHLEDMALDGVAGEVLYPSQGRFYFKVAGP